MNNPTSIVKTLFDEYKDINGEVENINKGGCGVFAEHLYKTLLALGTTPNLVVFTPDNDEFNKRIEGNEHCSYKACIYHVLVEIDGVLIDSDGIYNNRQETRYTVYDLQENKSLSLAVLSEWNEYPWMWNSEFNRENIQVIETKLQKCCEKVKINLEKSI